MLTSVVSLGRMTLNPLANPKGMNFFCELCQKPAYFQCTGCRCTYYCTEKHLQEDWQSIHELICAVITVMRAPQPHANSQEERQHRAQQQLLRKQHIVRLALQEGQRYLYEGKPQSAIPAALQALKMLADVHGNTDVKLTPAYLILAEAAIELDSLTEASQYLCQAQWAVLNASNGMVSPLVKSHLHRNLGQLAKAKSNWAEARRHFAEDVYQATLAGGLDTVEAAAGYYHMAAVFLKEDKPDMALSLHKKVVSLWCSFFKAHLSSLEEVWSAQQVSPDQLVHHQQHLPGQERHTLHPELRMEMGQQTEASSLLHELRRMKELEAPQILLVNIYYGLALLHTVTRAHDQSHDYGRQAWHMLDVISSDHDIHLAEDEEALLRQQLKHLLQVNGHLRNFNW